MTSQSSAKHGAVDYSKNVPGVFYNSKDPQELSGVAIMLPKRSGTTTEKFVFSWPGSRPRKKHQRKKLTTLVAEETNTPSTVEQHAFSWPEKLYKKKHKVKNHTTTSGNVQSNSYPETKTTSAKIVSTTTTEENTDITGISWKKFSWYSEVTSTHPQKEKQTTQLETRKTSSTLKPETEIDVDQESSDYELTESGGDYQSEGTASEEYADYYSSETDTRKIEPNLDLNENPTATEPSELYHSSQADTMNIEPTFQRSEEATSSESSDNTFSKSEVLNGEEAESENPYNIGENFLTLGNNEETTLGMSGEEINQDIVTASDDYFKNPAEQKPKNELTGLDSQQKKKLFEVADQLLKDFNTSTITEEKSTEKFDHETPEIVEATTIAEYEKVSGLSAENDYENSQNLGKGSSMQPEGIEETSNEGMSKSSEKSEVTEVETTDIMKKVISQYMTDTIPETVSEIGQYNLGEGLNATEENEIAGPSELTIAAAMETPESPLKSPEEEKQTELLEANTELNIEPMSSATESTDIFTENISPIRAWSSEDEDMKQTMEQEITGSKIGEEVSFTAGDLMATGNENEESPSVSEENGEIEFGRIEKSTVIYDENEEELSSPRVGDEFDISGELGTEISESDLMVKNTAEKTPSTNPSSSQKSLAGEENNTIEMNAETTSKEFPSSKPLLTTITSSAKYLTTMKTETLESENLANEEINPTAEKMEKQTEEPNVPLSSEAGSTEISQETEEESVTTNTIAMSEEFASLSKATKYVEVTDYDENDSEFATISALPEYQKYESEMGTSDGISSSPSTVKHIKPTAIVEEISEEPEIPVERSTRMKEVVEQDTEELTSHTHRKLGSTELITLGNIITLFSESSTSSETEKTETSEPSKQTSYSTTEYHETTTKTNEESSFTELQHQKTKPSLSERTTVLSETLTHVEISSETTVPGEHSTHGTSEPTEEVEEMYGASQISEEVETEHFSIAKSESSTISLLQSATTEEATKSTNWIESPTEGSISTIVPMRIEDQVSTEMQSSITSFEEKNSEPNEEFSESSTSISVSTKSTSTSTSNERLSPHIPSEETEFLSTVESKAPIEVTESEIEEFTSEIVATGLEVTNEITKITPKELSYFSEETETITSETTVSREIIATSTEASEETTSNIQENIEVTANETYIPQQKTSSFYESPVTPERSEFTEKSIVTESETPSTGTLLTHEVASLTATTEVSGTLTLEETEMEITHVLPHEMLSTPISTETESISEESLKYTVFGKIQDVTIQETASWIRSNILPEEISGSSGETLSITSSTVTLEEVELTEQSINITETETLPTETSTLVTTESELISSTEVNEQIMNISDNETTENIIPQVSSAIPSTISVEPSEELGSNKPIIVQMTTVVTATASERYIVPEETSSSIIPEQTKSIEESIEITESKTPTETSTHVATSLTSISGNQVSEELESTIEVTHISSEEISSSFMSPEMESFSPTEATEEFPEVTESEPTKHEATSWIPSTISTGISEEVSSKIPILVKMPTVVKATATGRYIPPHEMSSVHVSSVTPEEAVFTEESIEVIKDKTQPTETSTFEVTSSTSRILLPEELETTMAITHVLPHEMSSIFLPTKTESISSTEAKEFLNVTESEITKNNTLKEASLMPSATSTEFYKEITSNTSIIIQMPTVVEATASERYIAPEETSSSIILERTKSIEQSIAVTESQTPTETSTHVATSLTSLSSNIVSEEISSSFMSAEIESISSTEATEELPKVTESEPTKHEATSWIPFTISIEISKEVSSKVPIVVKMPTVVRSTATGRYIPPHTTGRYIPPHEISSVQVSSVTPEKAVFTEESIEVMKGKTQPTETFTLEVTSSKSPQELETTMGITQVLPHEMSSIFLPTETGSISSSEAKEEFTKVTESEITKNNTLQETSSLMPSATSTEEITSNTSIIVQATASERYIPPHEEETSTHGTKSLTSTSEVSSTLVLEGLETTVEESHVLPPELSYIFSSTVTESVPSTVAEGEFVKVAESEAIKHTTVNETSSWMPSTILTELSEEISSSTPVFVEMLTVIKANTSDRYEESSFYESSEENTEITKESITTPQTETLTLIPEELETTKEEAYVPPHEMSSILIPTGIETMSSTEAKEEFIKVLEGGTTQNGTTYEATSWISPAISTEPSEETPSNTPIVVQMPTVVKVTASEIYIPPHEMSSISTSTEIESMSTTEVKEEFVNVIEGGSTQNGTTYEATSWILTAISTEPSEEIPPNTPIVVQMPTDVEITASEIYIPPHEMSSFPASATTFESTQQSIETENEAISIQTSEISSIISSTGTESIPSTLTKEESMNIVEGETTKNIHGEASISSQAPENIPTTIIEISTGIEMSVFPEHSEIVETSTETSEETEVSLITEFMKYTETERAISQIVNSSTETEMNEKSSMNVSLFSIFSSLLPDEVSSTSPSTTVVKVEISTNTNATSEVMYVPTIGMFSFPVTSLTKSEEISSHVSGLSSTESSTIQLLEATGSEIAARTNSETGITFKGPMEITTTNELTENISHGTFSLTTPSFVGQLKETVSQVHSTSEKVEAISKITYEPYDMSSTVPSVSEEAEETPLFQFAVHDETNLPLTGVESSKPSISTKSSQNTEISSAPTIEISSLEEYKKPEVMTSPEIETLTTSSTLPEVSAETGSQLPETTETSAQLPGEVETTFTATKAWAVSESLPVLTTKMQVLEEVKTSTNVTSHGTSALVSSIQTPEIETSTTSSTLPEVSARTGSQLPETTETGAQLPGEVETTSTANKAWTVSESLPALTTKMQVLEEVKTSTNVTSHGTSALVSSIQTPEIETSTTSSTLPEVSARTGSQLPETTESGAQLPEEVETTFTANKAWTVSESLPALTTGMQVLEEVKTSTNVTSHGTSALVSSIQTPEIETSTTSSTLPEVSAGTGSQFPETETTEMGAQLPGEVETTFTANKAWTLSESLPALTTGKQVLEEVKTSTNVTSHGTSAFVSSIQTPEIETTLLFQPNKYETEVVSQAESQSTSYVEEVEAISVMMTHVSPLETSSLLPSAITSEKTGTSLTFQPKEETETEIMSTHEALTRTTGITEVSVVNESQSALTNEVGIQVSEETTAITETKNVTLHESVASTQASEGTETISLPKFEEYTNTEISAQTVGRLSSTTETNIYPPKEVEAASGTFSVSTEVTEAIAIQMPQEFKATPRIPYIPFHERPSSVTAAVTGETDWSPISEFLPKSEISESESFTQQLSTEILEGTGIQMVSTNESNLRNLTETSKLEQEQNISISTETLSLAASEKERLFANVSTGGSWESVTEIFPNTEEFSTKGVVSTEPTETLEVTEKIQAINESSPLLEEINTSTEIPAESTIVSQTSSLMQIPTEVKITTELTYLPPHELSKYPSILTDLVKPTGPLEATILSTEKELSGESEATLNGITTLETVQISEEIGKTSTESETKKHGENEQPTQISEHEISTYKNPMFKFHFPSSSIYTLSTSEPPGSTPLTSSLETEELLKPLGESFSTEKIPETTSKVFIPSVQTTEIGLSEIGRTSKITVTPVIPRKKPSSSETTAFQERKMVEAITKEPSEEQLEEFAFTRVLESSTLCETCSEETTSEELKAAYTTPGTTELEEAAKTISQDENMEQKITRYTNIKLKKTTKFESKSKTEEPEILRHTVKNEILTLKPTKLTSQILTTQEKSESGSRIETVTEASESPEYTETSEKLHEKGTEMEGTTVTSNKELGSSEEIAEISKAETESTEHENEVTETSEATIEKISETEPLPHSKYTPGVGNPTRESAETSELNVTSGVEHEENITGASESMTGEGVRTEYHSKSEEISEFGYSLEGAETPELQSETIAEGGGEVTEASESTIGKSAGTEATSHLEKSEKTSELGHSREEGAETPELEIEATVKHKGEYTEVSEGTSELGHSSKGSTETSQLEMESIIGNKKEVIETSELTIEESTETSEIEVKHEGKVTGASASEKPQEVTKQSSSIEKGTRASDLEDKTTIEHEKNITEVYKTVIEESTETESTPSSEEFEETSVEGGAETIELEAESTVKHESIIGKSFGTEIPSHSKETSKLSYSSKGSAETFELEMEYSTGHEGTVTGLSELTIGENIETSEIEVEHKEVTGAFASEKPQEISEQSPSNEEGTRASNLGKETSIQLENTVTGVYRTVIGESTENESTPSSEESEKTSVEGGAETIELEVEPTVKHEEEGTEVSEPIIRGSVGTEIPSYTEEISEMGHFSKGSAETSELEMVSTIGHEGEVTEASESENPQEISVGSTEGGTRASELGKETSIKPEKNVHEVSKTVIEESTETKSNPSSEESEETSVEGGAETIELEVESTVKHEGITKVSESIIGESTGTEISSHSEETSELGLTSNGSAETSEQEMGSTIGHDGEVTKVPELTIKENNETSELEIEYEGNVTEASASVKPEEISVQGLFTEGVTRVSNLEKETSIGERTETESTPSSEQSEETSVEGGAETIELKVETTVKHKEEITGASESIIEKSSGTETTSFSEETSEFDHSSERNAETPETEEHEEKVTEVTVSENPQEISEQIPSTEQGTRKETIIKHLKESTKVSQIVIEESTEMESTPPPEEFEETSVEGGAETIGLKIESTIKHEEEVTEASESLIRESAKTETPSYSEETSKVGHSSKGSAEASELELESTIRHEAEVTDVSELTIEENTGTLIEKNTEIGLTPSSEKLQETSVEEGVGAAELEIESTFKHKDVTKTPESTIRANVGTEAPSPSEEVSELGHSLEGNTENTETSEMEVESTIGHEEEVSKTTELPIKESSETSETEVVSTLKHKEKVTEPSASEMLQETSKSSLSIEEGTKTTRLKENTRKHEGEVTEASEGTSVEKGTGTPELDEVSTIENEEVISEVTVSHSEKTSEINVSESLIEGGAETEVTVESEKLKVTKTPMKSTTTSVLNVKTIQQENAPDMTSSGQAITEMKFFSGTNIEITATGNAIESIEEEEDAQVFHFSRTEKSRTLCEECAGAEISTEGTETGGTHDFSHEGGTEVSESGLSTEGIESVVDTTIRHEGKVTEASESTFETSESEIYSTIEHEAVEEDNEISELEVEYTVRHTGEVSELSIKEGAGTEITSHSETSEETSESGHAVKGTETSNSKVETIAEKEVTGISESSTEESTEIEETPHSKTSEETSVLAQSVKEATETSEPNIELTTEEKESESSFEEGIKSDTTSHSEKAEESTEEAFATSKQDEGFTVGSEGVAKASVLPTEEGSEAFELEKEPTTRHQELIEEGAQTEKIEKISHLTIEGNAESSEKEEEFTTEQNELTKESESRFNEGTESETTPRLENSEETSESSHSIDDEYETSEMGESTVEHEELTKASVSSVETSELENETVVEQKEEVTKVSESLTEEVAETEVTSHSQNSKETSESGHSIESTKTSDLKMETIGEDEVTEISQLSVEEGIGSEATSHSEKSEETSESVHSIEGEFATSEPEVGSEEVTKVSVSPTAEGAETSELKEEFTIRHKGVIEEGAQTGQAHETSESGPSIEGGIETSEIETESTTEHNEIAKLSKSPFSGTESETTPRSETFHETSESGQYIGEVSETSEKEVETNIGNEEVTKASVSSVKEATSESGHSIQGTTTSELKVDTIVEEKVTEISETSIEEGPEINETLHSEIPEGHSVEESTETSELKVESTVKYEGEQTKSSKSAMEEENDTEATPHFSKKSELSRYSVEDGLESSEFTVEYAHKHAGGLTESLESSFGGHETEAISVTGQSVEGTGISEEEVKSTIRHEEEIRKTSTFSTEEEAEKSEGTQLVATIIGAENITKEYTEEVNTADKMSSTVEISGTKIATQVFGEIVHSETVSELEETVEGTVSSHATLRTSETTEEVDIRNEEEEAETSISATFSVEIVTNETPEEENIISSGTSVEEEIIQKTTLKNITQSSKPAHSITPEEKKEKTEQSGITSPLSVKFDIRNVSHHTTYMSSQIPESTEEVAEGELLHFSKTPEDSTLCQECSNVTEKSTVSRKGGTTHEVSSKHSTNEKQEESTHKIASLTEKETEASAEITIKATTETESTELETKEIVETEESLVNKEQTEMSSLQSSSEEETSVTEELSEGTTLSLTKEYTEAANTAEETGSTVEISGTKITTEVFGEKVHPETISELEETVEGSVSSHATLRTTKEVGIEKEEQEAETSIYATSSVGNATNETPEEGNTILSGTSVEEKTTLKSITLSSKRTHSTPEEEKEKTEQSETTSPPSVKFDIKNVSHLTTYMSSKITEPTEEVAEGELLHFSKSPEGSTLCQECSNVTEKSTMSQKGGITTEVSSKRSTNEKQERGTHKIASLTEVSAEITIKEITQTESIELETGEIVETEESLMNTKQTEISSPPSSVKEETIPNVSATKEFTEGTTLSLTEEVNTAEKMGSTVEIIGTKITTEVLDKKVHLETISELEKTVEGRVPSHATLGTTKEMGIEKEEQEAETSISTSSSVENVTNETQEEGNIILSSTSVEGEIFQKTTLKNITLSSKPAHSITQEEKTEQSGITSLPSVKFDIKNVSHHTTYMSSQITESTEEVAEGELFHFSKTPAGSTLCQECSNVTDKSAMGHKGGTTKEVSSKHSTNEKQEGEKSSTETGTGASAEIAMKVTTQTKSTEMETGEIVETEESLVHTKQTETSSLSSSLKEGIETNVSVNKEHIESSTVTIGERTHSTKVHAEEAHSTQPSLEHTEKSSTHISEKTKHTTKAHPADHHKIGITAKTKPEDFLQTLTELSGTQSTSTTEEVSPTESSEDVEVLTELGVQDEKFVLKTAIENITEESHPMPSFKTVIHGASTHKPHTGSSSTKMVVFIVNNSGKKIEKINETALQKLLNRSISEVNLEYIDLYNISKELDGHTNKSEGPSKAESLILKGDGKVCHRSEFESNHACVCDVDTYLKSIEHKLGENLKVDIRHYNCSHLVSFHDGLIISNATKPVERRKRSLMYLSNKDRPSNVIENNDIEDVFSADYELQTSDSNILALPGTKTLLYCHNRADALLGNKGVTYSWEFKGDASKSGEVLPTNENPLIIHDVEIKNEGNYTCMKTEGGKKESYDHELEVVTLPVYKIQTTIFYSVNDTCSLSDGDLLYSYLPKIMGPILCGGSGKLCTVDVARPRCFTKNDDNFFNVTVTATMNDVGSIFPDLDESKCSSTNCKLKAYTNMVGLVNKNAEVVKKLPVFSTINPHLEFLTNVSFSGGKAETSKPPKIITTCAGGYGIEKFKQRICVVCPKHTFSGDDEAFCKICPAGQYQPQAGSKACLLCSSPVDDSMCLRMLYTDTKLFKIYVGVAFGLVLLMIFIIIFWNSNTRRYPKRQFEGSLKHHRAMRRRNVADIEKQDLEPLLKKDNENRRNSPPEVPPPDF